MACVRVDARVPFRKRTGEAPLTADSRQVYHCGVSGEGRKRTAESFRRIADASSIGLAFPIAIGIGYLWGHWLDGVLGSGPWLTIVFALLGVAAGFVNAFRTAIRIGKEEDAASKKQGE
jgi:ATP synthase protein I